MHNDIGTTPTPRRRSPAYAWAVVILLTVSFAFAMIDRMLLVLLVKPVKAKFALSDVEIGLLTGLAFTLLFVGVGVPMGRLADRYSRRAIIGLSFVGWSLMTIACGLAGTYGQLFLARLGVGVGEAGLSPAANSMISDYFPPEKLAAPIAFFSIGGSAGIGLAFIFGGTVVDLVAAAGQIHLPLVGALEGWQMAFLAVGAPGLAVAALFAAIDEPERTGRTLAKGSASLVDLLAFFRRHPGFLTSHILGSAFATFVVLSIHSWMPALLGRVYGLSAGEAGRLYGSVVLVCGVGGLVTGGFFATRLARRGHQDSHILVALVAVILAAGPAAAGPVSGSVEATLALAGVAVFGLASAIALAPVALQIVAPNELRAQVYAVYLLVISLLGYAIGPLAVAILTDQLFADETMVGRSMSIVAAVGGPASTACFAVSRRRYVKLLANITDR